MMQSRWSAVVATTLVLAALEVFGQTTDGLKGKLDAFVKLQNDARETVSAYLPKAAATWHEVRHPFPNDGIRRARALGMQMLLWMGKKPDANRSGLLACQA